MIVAETEVAETEVAETEIVVEIEEVAETEIVVETEGVVETEVVEDAVDVRCPETNLNSESHCDVYYSTRCLQLRSNWGQQAMAQEVGRLV